MRHEILRSAQIVVGVDAADDGAIGKLDVEFFGAALPGGLQDALDGGLVRALGHVPLPVECRGLHGSEGEVPGAQRALDGAAVDGQAEAPDAEAVAVQVGDAGRAFARMGRCVCHGEVVALLVTPPRGVKKPAQRELARAGGGLGGASGKRHRNPVQCGKKHINQRPSARSQGCHRALPTGTAECSCGLPGGRQFPWACAGESCLSLPLMRSRYCPIEEDA